MSDLKLSIHLVFIRMCIFLLRIAYFVVISKYVIQIVPKYSWDFKGMWNTITTQFSKVFEPQTRSS